jgi:hypothetical protein
MAFENTSLCSDSIYVPVWVLGIQIIIGLNMLRNNLMAERNASAPGNVIAIEP